MAPIEHDLSNSNAKPIAFFGAYAFITTSLMTLIGHRVLYRAYKALPPSQGTRSRQTYRKKHVLVYQGLSLLSLSFALYYLVYLLNISYEVWAYERGETVPLSLWGENGKFILDNGVLHLGRWFKDTNIIGEFWEVAMENSRRQWWTQQLFLGGSTWALYLAIEGQRRNIPHLWAFSALSMLTSLSFAQNLFFLAVLLTPVPLSEIDKHDDLLHKSTSGRGKHSRKASRTVQNTAATTETVVTTIPHRVRGFLDHYFPPKPADWTPHDLIWTAPLILSTIDTVLAGFAASTPSFNIFLSHVAINMFTPLVLFRLAPLRFGKSSSTSSIASARALTAFQTVGILSMLVYFSRSFVAVLDNDESQHRHYYFFRYHRSRLSHTGTSIGRVLGALSDHPACGRIAWDVILSGFGLVTWAGLRGTHPGTMLRAAGWASKAELQLASDANNYIRKEVAQLVNNVSDDDEPPAVTASPIKVRGRKSAAAKKATQNTGAGEDGEMAKAYEGDSTQEWKGDEEGIENWEAGTLAWGMMVLGGLGTATASVLGADVV